MQKKENKECICDFEEMSEKCNEDRSENETDEYSKFDIVFKDINSLNIKLYFSDILSGKSLLVCPKLITYDSSPEVPTPNFS